MVVELETSGKKGLERLLADDDFSLVLCDLSLPDLTGVDIHARLVREKPDMMKRFVVMTGGAVSSESRQFLDRYQGPVLHKPFTLTQVEALIQDLVGNE